MLNFFPIQFLALFAYFILRVITGTVLIYLGLRHAGTIPTFRMALTRSWWPYGGFSARIFVLFELITGAMLLFGFATQLAAIAVILMCLKLLIIHHWFQNTVLPPRIFYVLLFAVALSLFITGAGVFAVDLPL